MQGQQLYLEDVHTLVFTTEVVEVTPLPDNRFGVVLARSYFYPTGGGQEHDTGSIGPAGVVDVLKQADGRVLHVVDRALAPGPAEAKIDAGRRLRHMQHHTAQHLLTGCFLRLFDLDTVSCNINGSSPSTLDLPFAALSRADLDRVEDLANAVIFENRAVKSGFFSPQEIDSLPLRRKPTVSENIRLVEIDGFDLTPCGGTHCTATGQIGLVKITRTERPNKEVLRVHFVAGLQAAEVLRSAFDTVAALSALFGVHPRDLQAAIQHQAGQLAEAQIALQAASAELIKIEADRLDGDAGQVGHYRLAAAAFSGRSAQDLRALAGHLKGRPGLVSVLSVYDGQKLSLIVVCPPGESQSARDLLARLLAPVGGRGGGDAAIAQGGAALSAEQAQAFESGLRDSVTAVLQA